MRQKKENKIRLEHIEKKNIFLVPVDYFSSLPTRIQNSTIENNGILKNTVFQVPEGYFAKASKRMIEQVEKESLANKKFKDTIFSTPDRYFESLQKGIEEQTNLAPLGEQNKQEHFQVPEGYFETLGQKIQDKIDRKDNVIKVDFTHQAPVRYAIAASITFILAIGSLLYYLSFPSSNNLSHSSTNQEAIAQSLIARLDKKEIKHYLEKQDNIDTHEIMEFASEKKKQKINQDFEQELLSVSLTKKDKQALEMELQDFDLASEM